MRPGPPAALPRRRDQRAPAPRWPRAGPRGPAERAHRRWSNVSGAAGCGSALPDGARLSRPSACCSPPGARRDRRPRARARRPGARTSAATLKVNEHYQTAVPAHLRGGRRHRLPRPRLDLDGAGAGRHVPRLRPRVQGPASRASCPWPSTRSPRSPRWARPRRAARQKGIPCLRRAARATADNARGQIIGDLHGLLKLVFSPDDQRLLGVHIVGERRLRARPRRPAVHALRRRPSTTSSRRSSTSRRWARPTSTRPTTASATSRARRADPRSLLGREVDQALQEAHQGRLLGGGEGGERVARLLRLAAPGLPGGGGASSPWSRTASRSVPARLSWIQGPVFPTPQSSAVRNASAGIFIRLAVVLERLRASASEALARPQRSASARPIAWRLSRRTAGRLAPPSGRRLGPRRLRVLQDVEGDRPLRVVVRVPRREARRSSCRCRAASAPRSACSRSGISGVWQLAQPTGTKTARPASTRVASSALGACT